MENLKLLFQLYFRPAFAMGEIIDKGGWLFGAIAVLIVSFAFQFGVNSRILQTYAVSAFDVYQSRSGFNNRLPNTGRLTPDELAKAEYYANPDIEREFLRQRLPFPIFGHYISTFFSFDANFFTPLVSLSFFYVPLTILLVVIFGHLGNFGVVFGRDYGTLAACSMMAYAAAHLPFAIAGILLLSQPANPLIFAVFWLASGLYFGVLMVFALRVVFGVNYGTAVFVIAVSWLGFSLGIYVFKFISPWLFSPFILFFVVLYFGGFLSGEVRGFGNALRQRQDFKRFLQNATVNPRDADAHVQLGLIYNGRRQEAKALEHFTRAVEIDPNEPDANYELGKIARKTGELQKAIEYFSIVVEQNDKYGLSEIWREIGATYLAANMFAEAREALEKFVTRRSFDAEGLYYLGKVLKAQGEPEKAREIFEQAIESARSSPDYRRHQLRQWSKLAQKEI